MAPAGKRKRGDRSYSYDDDHSNRPSPHRPQNLALASPQQQQQQQQQHINSPRGGRRGSRSGGRGGHHNANQSNATQPSPTAMNPPAQTPQAPSRPTPSTPSLPPPPPKEPAFKPASLDVPESNEHLTPARVASWNADARNAVVQAAVTAQRDGDMFNLNIVFLELIQAAGEQLMAPDELGSMVRDIVAAPADEWIDPATCFLDCIATYTQGEPKHPEDLRKNPSIQAMLIATEIDPDRMRRQLEETLVMSMELVRPTFHVKAVRATTKAMYQQANYNLLREETEGYSKLMTEYFTTVNSEPPRHDVVSDTFQRVTALIGTFDLDVGRVLDVTLDVFANLLVKHYRFFIKYLRVSTWWPKQLGTDNVQWQEPDVNTLPNWALPTSQTWYYTDEQKEEQLRLREARDIKFWRLAAEKGKEGEKHIIKAFFELGARRITRDMRSEDKAGASDASQIVKKSATHEWADQWITETGTLPPLGNEVAAQLLGFKLQFYASDSRDAHDVLPDNLIYLAALLIKIGFISLPDLWEHLYPQGEDLVKLQAKLKAEKAEREAKRNGKAPNALTTAGALSDETPSVPAVSRLRDAESKPSSKQESERNTPAQSDEEVKPTLPDPADQKVALLRSLLCIGAIPEALFIIGTHKWMLDLYPDLHSYIFRIAHHSLGKVYEASRPVPLGQVPLTTKGMAGNSPTRVSDFIPRRTLRWAKPDLKDAGDGIDYRFYWEDWVDNVPICQTVDDVFLLCNSWLGLVGVECGRDVLLMTKLARIGRKSVVDDPSAENMQRWSDLLSTFLMPALTFTGENPGVVNEMWELLRRFDTATRYTLYSHWEKAAKPAMRAAFGEVIQKTTHLLNRVSNTNTKLMGRAIARVSYACPVIVFKRTLERGQQYLNMIDALVSCSQYLTHMGYDCLTYSLINIITSGNKPTLQGDGMLTEGWLKNAAVFVAKVFTKYSRHMDPRPILEYISEQLLDREGKLFVMKVLEELITAMSGVSLIATLKEDIVIALSAGPRLRTFTLEKLGDRRHAPEIRKPAERLMNHFKDSALAPPILIALADQVQAYLYRENQHKVPDKVVLFNYDNLKLNFFQFLDYLRHYLTTDEFDEQIPELVELISDYYLDTEFAFHISRDSIAAKANAIRLQSRQSVEANRTDEDVTMSDASKTDSGVTKDVATDNAEDVEMGDATTSDTPNGVVDNKNETAQEGTAIVPRSNAEIDKLVSQLQVALPDKFGKHPCLKFLVTFWQLSLQDVQDPESGVLKRQYKDAKDRMIATANSTVDGRRKDVNAVRQARDDANKLGDEYEAYVKQAQQIQSGLREEMHFWFSDVASMDPSLHMTLLQDCFFARARMSSKDAQFSASMLFFMHKSKVPKFRLIKVLDDFFNSGRLSAMFFSMSEDEAKNVGRFMNDILQELGRWHGSETVYKQFECVKVFNDEGRPKNSDSFLKYSDFRLLLGKWHKQIHDALHVCLRRPGKDEEKSLRNTAQYTELRNSINILKAIAPSFPRIRENATTLQEDVEFYSKQDNEPRTDIQVAASSLKYEFKRNESRLRSQTMFLTGEEDPKEATSDRTAKSRSSKTPDVQGDGTKKLNASAQPFQPPKPSTTNGIAKPAAENSGDDDRKPPAATFSTPTPASRVNGNDASRPPPRSQEPPAAQQFLNRDTPKRMGPGLGSANSTPVPARPDSRGGYQAQQANRVSHNLPTRPDTQPLRSRQNERPGDRPLEYNQSHGRHDSRINGPSEYGRLERIGGAPRGRSASPARHPRSRSQDRAAAAGDRPEWPGREAREYDERSLRVLSRDIRAPPNRDVPYGDNQRDHRDVRDQRDYRAREPLRERTDSRGPPPMPNTQADSRGRPHTGPGMAPNDVPPHRRDIPHQSDRGALPPRPFGNAGPPANDRPPINPQRAALIEQDVTSEREVLERSPYAKDDRINPERAALVDDRNRNAPVRSDRDGRDRHPFAKEGVSHGRDARNPFLEASERDNRDSRNPFAKEERGRIAGGRPDRDNRPDDRDIRRDRPLSPRRDERLPAMYYDNNRRDYRDERSQPQPYPRDRRDDFSGNAPTGPRSGRDGPGPSRVSREMFQPSQPPRPAAPTQDPNYGRLNQPAESIPSGPKYPASDSRDMRSHPPAPAQNMAPAASQPSGVHPSRMSMFDGPPGPPGPPLPPLRTDLSNAPSGPRGSGRTPLPSPSTRGPPTGPSAVADRHVRRQDSRTALGAINNVLAQSSHAPSAPPAGTPPERSGERSHRRRERSRSAERKDGGNGRDREKRDGSRRERETRESGRESSHRERSSRSDRGDGRDERRKDDREREKKRVRDLGDQPHGETKRSRR